MDIISPARDFMFKRMFSIPDSANILSFYRKKAERDRISIDAEIRAGGKAQVKGAG